MILDLIDLRYWIFSISFNKVQDLKLRIQMAKLSSSSRGSRRSIAFRRDPQLRNDRLEMSTDSTTQTLNELRDAEYFLEHDVAIGLSAVFEDAVQKVGLSMEFQN